MPTIDLPKSFFKKERDQIYANWQVAFWRELFQNSLDAQATSVVITLTERDGAVGVCFSDNGWGMTTEEIETVYFKLGESTKDPANGTVGGFGRARILTNFSMASYRIATRDNLIVGSGASYTLDQSDHVDGCHVEIEIDDADFESIQRSLGIFLSSSQLSCSVSVNGTSWTAWALRGKVIGDLRDQNIRWATVYANDKGMQGHILVRVGGMLMFDRYKGKLPNQIIVEIDSSLSQKVLTGSRDTLRHGYDVIFDNLLNEMGEQDESIRVSTRQHPVKLDGTRFTTVASTKWKRQYNDPERQHHTIPVLVPLATPPRLDRVISQFYSGKSSDNFQLLLEVWRCCCAAAVRSFIKMLGRNEHHWSVGFCFGEAKALYYRADNVDSFLINPLTHSGHPAFPVITVDTKKLFKPHQISRLMALAAHEVTHMRHVKHDDGFALLMTDIMADMETAPAFEPKKRGVLQGVHKQIAEIFETGSRQRGMKRTLGVPHLIVLSVLIRENRPMRRDEIISIVEQESLKSWDIQDKASIGQFRHWVHARLGDMTTERVFGETLINKGGRAISAASGKVVQLFEINQRGRERFVEEFPQAWERHDTKTKIARASGEQAEEFRIAFPVEQYRELALNFRQKKRAG